MKARLNFTVVRKIAVAELSAESNVPERRRSH